MAQQALGKMYYVYVLENEKGKHYTGSGKDIVTRLRRHNQNSVRSTKNKGPLKVIYKEKFDSRLETRERENELKSYKGNTKFRKIIET